MKRTVLPILLALSAGAAMACPGADKAKDAKASADMSMAAVPPTMTQQIKAEAEKKEPAKTADVKKSKS
jgi:hypothetical protein